MQRLLNSTKMLTWLWIVIFHAFLVKRLDFLSNSEIPKLFQIHFATSFKLNNLHSVSIFCCFADASIFHMEGLRILFCQIAATCWIYKGRIWRCRLICSLLVEQTHRCTYFLYQMFKQPCAFQSFVLSTESGKSLNNGIFLSSPTKSPSSPTQQCSLNIVFNHSTVCHLGSDSWERTTGHQLRWTTTGLIQFSPFSSWRSPWFVLVWPQATVRIFRQVFQTSHPQSQGLQTKALCWSECFHLFKTLANELNCLQEWY